MKKTSKKQENNNQNIPAALQVFSKTRDVDVANPYHLDGDVQMQQLAADPVIKKQINNIVELYETDQQGKINQQQYKRMQRKMALALRPDIQQDQLQFTIDQDWQLDSTDGTITKQTMNEKIFQMVDVWTIGVERQQYITFIKLLYKKINIKQKSKK